MNRPYQNLPNGGDDGLNGIIKKCNGWAKSKSAILRAMARERFVEIDHELRCRGWTLPDDIPDKQQSRIRETF